MAGKVLITHSSSQVTGELERDLLAAGCEVLCSTDIDSTQKQLQQCPDLLLLDLDIARQVTPPQLASLASQLELAEAFCLRLCPREVEASDQKRLVPFACGSLYAPFSAALVLEPLAILLRAKEAETERNRVQDMLIMHRMEVEEGLRSASHIQRSLLPSRMTESDHFEFAWQFIPCETVGGDLFNIMPLSENTLLVYMIDVSGHGVPSAMVTVSVHQSLSDRTGRLVKHRLSEPPYYRISSPAEVLTALDSEYPYERFEKFFTISYLLMEPASGRLRYANGGHPPPLLIRTDGTRQWLQTGGTLVGMGGLLPYEEEELFLQPGDRLYLYSDGITEHENPQGEMFGQQRLADFFYCCQTQPLQETADAFIDQLKHFGAGKDPADDISLLCIQYNAV